MTLLGAVRADHGWQRCFALNGLIFIVLCLIGLEVCWPQPPDFALSAEATARFYAAHRTGFLTGITLCEVAMAAYVTWTIQLGAMLWRLDNGSRVKAIAATACGLATPFLLAGDLAVFAVAAYRPTEINPDVTQTLSDIAWIGSELFWPILAAEMALIGVIMLASRGREGAFPVWLGWYTLVAALVEPFQAAIIFTKSGPLAPDGLLTWYAAVGTWGLWAAATSIAMYRQLGLRPAHADQLAAPGRRASAT
jgi:hypothetical protein